MEILVGVDLGTTKLAALALDAGSGALLAVRDCANRFQLPAGEAASEQDAAAICAAAMGLLRELVNDQAVHGADILGVGVTGQMHGVVIIGDDGTPLTPLINWQDGRGQWPDAGTDMSYADAVCTLLGEERVQRSGGRPASGYGSVTLYRLARGTQLPADGKALTIHDLLVYQLCGHAATDPTDAASWGLYDVRDGEGWLPGAEEALGIPTDILPEILPTGTVAGTISPAGAVASGLPQGVPVAVALGDNQASFLASVPSLTTTLLLNLGTGGQMTVASPAFLRHPALETRPLIPGHWLLVGASLCGGRAYQLLARFFAQVGADLLGVPVDEASLYPRMNVLADAVEGIALPVVAPLFCGTRVDPHARASISGLTPENFSPAALTRATIQGMLDELLQAYEIARAAGAVPVTVVGAGNALRRNPVMQREISTRTGLELLLPPLREEAAVGAALTAGVASGVITDWQHAGKLVAAAILNEGT